MSDTALSGRFEADLKDLDVALQLDADGDGAVSDDEFQARADEIFHFFSDRLTLRNDGAVLELVPTQNAVLRAGQRRFGQVGFQVLGLDTVPETLEIEYQPLSDVVRAGHLGFALIENNTRTGLTDNEGYVSLAFRPDSGPQTLHLAGEPAFKVFKDFVIHGIWHIWLGFDHVLFLITLLLPAVMAATARGWVPLEDFRTSLWTVVKIVTVFTVSHSVTLSLSALGVVQLPVPLVEAIIALSIAVVAAMNMIPRTHKWVLLCVFVFGLFHGFGFANVLAPLGINPTQKVIGLAAFNVGVEIGQIAIVVVVFPALWLMRRWAIYKPLALQAGSVAVILLACVWFTERTTGGSVRSFIEQYSGIDI